MKIDKAIELLSDSAHKGMTTHGQDFKDACKLGIQALIRVKNARSTNHSHPIILLPGETE